MPVEQELRLRYQQTRSAVRRRRDRAREFRHRGWIDYMGEYELARAEGRQAALAWLLGKVPLAPVTQRVQAADPEQVMAELDSAAPRPADRWRVPAILPESFAGEPTYVDGVVEVLRWFLLESAAVRRPAG